METPRPTNAEMAQLVGMLQDAGLVEVIEDDAGLEAYRLTDDGVRTGHMLAMGDENDGDALLEALLQPSVGAPSPSQGPAT